MTPQGTENAADCCRCRVLGLCRISSHLLTKVCKWPTYFRGEEVGTLQQAVGSFVARDNDQRELGSWLVDKKKGKLGVIRGISTCTCILPVCPHFNRLGDGAVWCLELECAKSEANETK